MLNKQLPEQVKAQLQAIWNDPFGAPSGRQIAARLRTVVMLQILYETGMRRGELLALKLKNFLESTGGPGACLAIERNDHDEFDSRVAQSNLPPQKERDQK